MCIRDRANAYDMNRANPDEAQAIARKGKPLKAAKWALRIAGWAENVLAAVSYTHLMQKGGALYERLPGVQFSN